MATARSTPPERKVMYPTTDGRPMAETDRHRIDLIDLVQILDAYFALDPQVYVSGNMLMYYVRGNKRKHVSPDVFLARGVPKQLRDYYLVWEEGKGPDVVIELTSSSTRSEDTKRKFALYQDTLHVTEYFLFDSRVDYLDPPLQGFRLEGGKYVPIHRVRDRLPSEVLGLHLERSGWQLRLYDPAKQQWLPTPSERAQRAESTASRAEAAAAKAEAAAARAEAAQMQAEAEVIRLRAELERSKRGG